MGDASGRMTLAGPGMAGHDGSGESSTRAANPNSRRTSRKPSWQEAKGLTSVTRDAARPQEHTRRYRVRDGSGRQRHCPARSHAGAPRRRRWVARARGDEKIVAETAATRSTSPKSPTWAFRPQVVATSRPAGVGKSRQCRAISFSPWLRVLSASTLGPFATGSAPTGGNPSSRLRSAGRSVPETGGRQGLVCRGLANDGIAGQKSRPRHTKRAPRPRWRPSPAPQGRESRQKQLGPRDGIGDRHPRSRDGPRPELTYGRRRHCRARIGQAALVPSQWAAEVALRPVALIRPATPLPHSPSMQPCGTEPINGLGFGQAPRQRAAASGRSEWRRGNLRLARCRSRRRRRGCPPGGMFRQEAIDNRKSTDEAVPPSRRGLSPRRLARRRGNLGDLRRYD